MRYSALNRKLR